ncbi:alpha-amylase family glycosyl hydrolase [Kribbella sp. VKM Ac-2571]|uniref:alpha-amylase family glycosyl hydrolase n=1 Tax=Kribbella sp. VKM Ac-2571 TaxID=2512222 RepID=UPI0035158A54
MVYPATTVTGDSTTQPSGAHWYQNAVFYQALVRAYRDADGDGYGDLRGLIDQLDYLELLGVDCVWLNPIYPSPLKDGGYDVSDYTGVHPSAGTLDDFKELLAEAHQRGIRIIVDFVPNHSSDQHPWFQESRRDPNGPYGDFYVWSDTPEQFYTPLHTDPDGTEYILDPDTGERRDIDPESTWLRITSSSGRPLIGPRIIFTDTETSNWTWDPVRGQYFWHRFFSHQPDLNFDNPTVQQAILDAQEFWLELGVDGFRVDAVPYLFVREGTNGENLPETHAFVRRMRALADRYGAMVLCEANQPLDDLMAYFGDPAKGGDGFQMAFDFALMPRLYMALASGVAEPIRELVRSRPELPASAALMTFLDNHDERTTEMVSQAEREYLHATYDPTHLRKSNDGFVGRLAPLLGNDIGKLKLANALLFALHGSPIIYYGDELGMGDDPTLPDRDAQRTPMPWTSDRNAGFSVAAPYRPSSGDPDPRHLYLPPVSDPVNGFREVNVEHQLYDESSVLYWTRELIRSYKLHPALAVGNFTDLAGSNGHVLAFAREHGDEVMLGIFNLAGTTQATDLDLSAWAGRGPVDILGRQRFRVIDDLPYAVTLEGHGFRWLSLTRDDRGPGQASRASSK